MRALAPLPASSRKNEATAFQAVEYSLLLIVDEDGVPGRGEKLKSVVSQLRTDLRGRPFLTVMALREVEIFPLAGHELSAGWKWEAIRSDSNVKNTYFRQLVERERTHHLPHQGRKKLMSTAMKQWSRIKSLCPEETIELAGEIKEVMDARHQL